MFAPCWPLERLQLRPKEGLHEIYKVFVLLFLEMRITTFLRLDDEVFPPQSLCSRVYTAV